MNRARATDLFATQRCFVTACRLAITFVIIAATVSPTNIAIGQVGPTRPSPSFFEIDGDHGSMLEDTKDEKCEKNKKDPGDPDSGEYCITTEGLCKGVADAGSLCET